ncbi:ParA family protein, partial [Streptomyces sp. SID7803]|nr:ParA family protein [Streptomyces sp. SID7803]
MMDGLHVNAMAGNESGRDTARLADFDETPPQGTSTTRRRVRADPE